MDTNKRKKIVYSLFVLAVIYGLYNLTISFDKKSTELTQTYQKQSAPQFVLPLKTINIEEYSALEWGRDPFYRPKKTRSAAVSEEKQIEWILNGILFDKKAPTAVINKNIVGIGDKIKGAIIIDITKTKVILKNENSDIFTLEITKDKS